VKPLSAHPRHAELLSRLGDQVEALTNSDGWQHWLAVAARFRTYSLHNQLLIFAQRPTATRVAGYRAWQALGRQVKRGEPGIAILAPLLRRVIDDDQAGEDGARVQLAGFRVVYVFDVAQTEGEPLPTLSLPAVQSVDSALFDQLLRVAARHDITVEPVEDGPDGARGWWDVVQRRIMLVTSYPLASQTRTLLHELAHAFDDASLLDQRAERELVAESVAYLVGTSLGMDMSEASTVYVASWGGNTERIEALAQRTLRVAAVLEDTIREVVVSPPA
jgi:antirestriction protein ArdC